ncbi:hypothetical protein [Mycolicibacterium lutetiense]
MTVRIGEGTRTVVLETDPSRWSNEEPMTTRLPGRPRGSHLISLAMVDGGVFPVHTRRRIPTVGF